MFAKIVILLPMLLFVGCGEAKNPLHRQPVSGKVILDGKPVVQGTIQFTSLSGPAESIFSGGLIKDGAYHLPESGGLPPGQYQVSISSSPPASPTPTDPVEAMKAAEKPIVINELIPAKYNLKSELKIEIKEERSSVVDFDLKS